MKNTLHYRILIVDDNLNFIEAFKYKLSDFFNNNSVAIDSASDGFEALKLIDSNYYNYIFMDIDMPNLNGIQTTQMVASSGRNMNVIALSFHKEFILKEQMISAGAKNYLIKEDIDDNVLERIFQNY